VSPAQPPLRSSVSLKIGIPNTRADPKQLDFYVF
jgi:hypothetical protein